MKNKDLNKKLKSLSIHKKRNWRETAKYRIENRKWLDYSAKIAMRVLAAIESKKDFNQITLANLLNISPQQVSKILKGQQNLTLKSIANLSESLGIELISFPKYDDSYVILSNASFVLNQHQRLSNIPLNIDKTKALSVQVTSKIEQSELVSVRGELNPTMAA